MVVLLKNKSAVKVLKDLRDDIWFSRIIFQCYLSIMYNNLTISEKCFLIQNNIYINILVHLGVLISSPG